MKSNGGADGDRTHGLMNAIHALSQLSYSPTERKSNTEKREMSKMIGAGGRNRTDTGWKPRGILSPVRLPVSPLRHKYQYKENCLLCQMKWGDSWRFLKGPRTSDYGDYETITAIRRSEQ